MKDRICFLLMTIAVVITFTSCGKDPEVPDPGSFVLTELKDYNSDGTNIYPDIEQGRSGFDLGDLKASKEFLFLLTNGGSEPIFEIQLETDNNDFVLSPDQIEYLSIDPTYGNEETTGLIPLLTLGIVHGTQLNGVGYTDLLSMGGNSANMTISGKTYYGGDIIDISSTYSVEIFAKIMDIKIYCNGNELDLTDTDGSTSSNLGGLGFIRYYHTNSDQIEIENTGNTEIKIYYGYEDNLSNSLTLLPGESGNATLVFGETIYFMFDSDGTITDDQRLQLGNDGNAYLCIRYS